MSQLKTTLYPVLHPLFAKHGRPLLREKTESTDELVAVYDSMHTVVDALKQSNFTPHTYLSTLKFVEVAGDRYYESSSWVYLPNGLFGEYQYHVYIIPVDDKIRVYAHREAPWIQFRKHQNAA